MPRHSSLDRENVRTRQAQPRRTATSPRLVNTNFVTIVKEFWMWLIAGAAYEQDFVWLSIFVKNEIRADPAIGQIHKLAELCLGHFPGRPDRAENLGQVFFVQRRDCAEIRLAGHIAHVKDRVSAVLRALFEELIDCCGRRRWLVWNLVKNVSNTAAIPIPALPPRIDYLR